MNYDRQERHKYGFHFSIRQLLIEKIRNTSLTLDKILFNLPQRNERGIFNRAAGMASIKNMLQSIAYVIPLPRIY
jgi:hypothetical protein